MEVEVESTCIHQFQALDDVTQRCHLCGIEKVVTSYIETGAEWRDYRESAESTNRARCGYKAYNDSLHMNTVFLQSIGIDAAIMGEIGELYKKVVKGDIIRFPFNKAILFICTHTVYKSKSRYLEYTELQRQFGLTRKQISNGMKYFRIKVTKNRVKLDTSLCVSTEQYLCEMCKDLDLPTLVDTDIKDSLISMYQQVINRSEVINHSSSKALATAIIKSHVRCMCDADTYSDICHTLNARYATSDTTMLKLEKEIKVILNTGCTTTAQQRTGLSSLPEPMVAC